ncbi:MAG: phenylalanine--tRNA ligase subunit beta [Bacteroidota bacterium]
MNISYNWLKQFLKLDWPAEKTAELLTDLGLEVEGIAPFESIQGGLKGVVVGHVISCEEHPNADRLKLTTVDLGAGEPVQIVCGAPNVSKGQKVAVATIGTALYSKEGEAWTIKKGKIRGEESHGMICAEDELGLGEGPEGIMVLSDELKPGTPCSEVFEVENDEVFEIGLTPNRADAMSHFGVARDLKAGMRQKDLELELITPPVSHFNVDNRSLRIDVEVKDQKLAPRYCGITLDNLIVQPSPLWLQNRLRAIGHKPINNVVDATNYVLHEMGQPLHAFDANRIHGKKIIVKTMPKGTQFTTLEGEERELHQDDLMICDTEKPMCIAGVFGGIYSGVTEDTTSIFLESAYFDPVSIRKTAKRHGLNTDASFRFERGTDIEITEYALKRAALLIKEIAGGDITSDIVDLYPKKKEDHHVFLTFDKVNGLVGQEIPRDTIKGILASLDIQVKNVTEAGLGLVIPSYRVDVTREVDVIEEILRVYGYNNIAFDKKLNASVAPTSRYEDYKVKNIIGNLLASQGYFEILTNSLSSPKYDMPKNAVTMLNPLSADLSVLRNSMVYTGLEVIAYNVNRKNGDLRLFEFGKTYYSKDDTYVENKHLCLYLTGNRNPDAWNMAGKKTDFFYLKSRVENVLNRLGIIGYVPFPTTNDLFSEGLSLLFKEKELVVFGNLTKSVRASLGIKQEVLFADFNWDNILSLLKKHKISYRDIPKNPEVKRDFALLLDEGVTFEQIHSLGMRSEKRLLKNISLFDVYMGKNLPTGKKSYAVSFTLQDEKSTLTEKQIDKIMTKLRKNFETELGAELR